jgi:hypothetical protein
LKIVSQLVVFRTCSLQNVFSIEIVSQLVVAFVGVHSIENTFCREHVLKRTRTTTHLVAAFVGVHAILGNDLAIPILGDTHTHIVGSTPFLGKDARVCVDRCLRGCGHIKERERERASERERERERERVRERERECVCVRERERETAARLCDGPNNTQTVHASTRTVGSRGMGACWLPKARRVTFCVRCWACLVMKSATKET